MTRRRSGPPLECRGCGVIKPAEAYYDGKRKCVPCWAEQGRNKARYGVGPGWFEKALTRQGGVCGICRGGPLTRAGGGGYRKGQAHIDHDHKTGNVRAVLCVRCNLTIGYFDDNPFLLREAADYLDAHSIAESST